MIIPDSTTPRSSASASTRTYESAWSRSPYPTIQSSQAFQHRLRFILRRLAREPWLPLHLRNRVKQTCEQLSLKDRNKTLTPSQARKEIEQLASLAFQYDDLILRSSTLCQIRALDMELNEQRYRYLAGTPVTDIKSA